MTKVLLATEKPFAAAATKGIEEILGKAGYQLVKLEKYTDHADFVNAAKDVEAIIIRSDKATKDVIDAAKNLKIIVRAGAGFDNIDLAACTANGVVAMNTPGQNSNAVAELVFGMMVMSARNYYNGKSGVELKGKKIGIHAYGNVGQNVGRIARGFGMEVYAFDPFMSAEQIAAAGATPIKTVEELYSSCDYVSIHIPATETTKKSINYALVNRMPKGATLINTARKEIINEEELVKLMADRPDLKYLSDIMPDNAADFAPFEGRYFFTPKKMGAQTEEANVNAGLAAANQIVGFIERGEKRFQVNK